MTGRVSTSNNISSNEYVAQSSDVGVVYSVILDENDKYIKNKPNKLNYVGAVIYKKLDDFTTKPEDLPLAIRHNQNDTTLPVRNEIVRIIQTNGGTFYERLGTTDNPNNNAIINTISFKHTSKDEEKVAAAGIQEIRTVQQIGLPKTKTESENNFDKLGDYFEYQPGIHKLKFFEGDKLIESRFGQSIRFSGYNNSNKSFSPSIIIRNGENSISRLLPLESTTEEDINKDGSIIAITSNQKELGFQPGTVDRNGKSDFETKPASFDKYPDKLNGDQILLNSGRIVISSKTGELIFYSKKNYGFISDGNLSIDNKLGIDISVGDDIFVMTNNRNINFYTGKGSIFLGNEQLEPMVKGQKLVDLLLELMEAVVNMQFLTPSGPSKIGPENTPKFNEIAGKLNNILSKQNQTS